MSLRKLFGRFAASQSAHRAERPDYFRTVLEPLETRMLLSVSTLPWAIDSANSPLTMSLPDQTITVTLGASNDTIKVRLRNQSTAGSGGTWTDKNVGAFSGNLAIDYVDGSTIKFMMNDPTNFPNPQGVYSNFGIADSGAYLPNPGTPSSNPAYNPNLSPPVGLSFYPNLYSNFTYNPAPGDNSSPGQDGSGTYNTNSTTPAAFATRINATITYPVVVIPNFLTLPYTATGDFANLSFSHLTEDVSSGVLSASGGTFGASATNLGATGQTTGFQGLNFAGLAQIPSALSVSTGGTPAANGATAGTVVSTGPLTRKVTLPVNIPFSLPGLGTTPVTGSITGQLIATVTLQAPVVDLDGTDPGVTFSNLWSTLTGPVNVAGAAASAPANATIFADTTNLSLLKVSMATFHTGDVLSATTSGTGITQTFTPGSPGTPGTLTLSGSDSVANYQTVLRSVTYNNTAPGGPGVTSETANVVANDGSLDSTPIAVATITINTPPVVDLNGAAGGTGFTSSWTGGPAVNIADANATVADDGGTLASIKVVLNSPHTGDVLAATTVGSITQSFVNNTLTLSGSDSVANYQTVLRSVTYNNTAGGPGVTSETANVVANDGSLDSTPIAVATININTPPVVDLNGAAGGITFTSSWTGSAVVNIADSTATVIDDGGTLASMKVELNSPHTGDVLSATTVGSITQSFVNNTLTLSGTDTVANYQSVLRSVTYTNTAIGGRALPPRRPTSWPMTARWTARPSPWPRSISTTRRWSI